MIKGIIFDCFGVLTGDKWKEFVGSLPADQQEPARELNRALDRGQLGLQDFSREIAGLTGRMPDRVEAIMQAEMQKNEPLLGYIKQLKQNYRIGLLSNIASDWIRTDFLNAAEQALFDDMIFSYQVGLVKPDGRIFELAANRLDLTPGEIVFTDDSAMNCQGAKKAGMNTIQYDNFANFRKQLDTLLGVSGS